MKLYFEFTSIYLDLLLFTRLMSRQFQPGKTEHGVPSSVNTPHVSVNLSQLSFINPSFSSLELGALILVSTKWRCPKSLLFEHLSGKIPQYRMFSFKAFKWCLPLKTEHWVPSSVNTPHVSVNLSQFSCINASVSSLEPGALILVSTKWRSPKSRLFEHLSGKPPQYRMFSLQSLQMVSDSQNRTRVPSSVNTPYVSDNLSQFSCINSSFSSLEQGALILVSSCLHKMEVPKKSAIWAPLRKASSISHVFLQSLQMVSDNQNRTRSTIFC